jgi:hypothetical protein
MPRVNTRGGRRAVALWCGSCATIGLAASLQTVTAQTPSTDQVLPRATAYVVDFVERFSAVVAEERYVQESSSLPQVSGSGANKQLSQAMSRRRILRSDFLLVRRKADSQWNTFRDVFEVDGRAVRDRSERLTQLLARPEAQADEEARRIAYESARFNLAGPSRTIDNPLTVLALLQPEIKGRFGFGVARPDKAFAPMVAVFAYRELAVQPFYATAEATRR